jgi:hypothetical protein
MKKGICKAGLWAVALIVAAGILGCQSDDDVTGPVILNEDIPYYGVSGWCRNPNGTPVNGVECKVWDPDWNQWFSTGYSAYHHIYGDGWFECSTTYSGPFPCEADALRVRGRKNNLAWGVSDEFAWEYPNVTNVGVWRLW